MRQALRTMGLIALVVAATFLQGCVANPFQHTDTLEKKAFATYGTFTVGKEQAAQIYIDPATPEQVKIALKSANDVATPPMNSMFEAAMVYKDAREALEQGATAEERWLIASASLLQWYTKAMPVYSQFKQQYESLTGKELEGETP